MKTARDDIPMGYTRDALGNALTYKNSDGHWYEYTCDALGNALTHKKSTIFNGALMRRRATDGIYTLFVSDAGQVSAGCRNFDSVAEALNHWCGTSERAELFTNALRS